MGSLLTRVSLSLVTYTYNDAELARGLLDHVPCWTVPPTEILVVDDHSDEVFALQTPSVAAPRPKLPDVQILRLPHNGGPTGAKKAGLGAASRPLILSIDCDVRLPPQWIAACLPLLRSPSTGLVSSHIVCDAGSDDVSRYVDRRYSFRPKAGSVPFVPGCVFLMRREVYHACGGLAKHTSRINDDVYLSRILRENGYDLVIAPELEARQERRMSLVACIRRAFTWDMPYFARNLAEGKPFGELLATFIVGARLKMDNTLPQERHLHYFDLLYLLYGCLCLAREQKQMEGAQEAVWRSFAGLLGLWPHVWQAVQGDMPRFFPHFNFTAAQDQEGQFSGVAELFAHAFSDDVLRFLDAYLAAHRLSEGQAPHFSLYERAGDEVL